MGTEFRKGILFVRLKGELTVSTILTLNMFLEKTIGFDNFRFLVLNLEKLNKIDLVGINLLIKINERLKLKQGEALICGLLDSLVTSKKMWTQLYKHVKLTHDELGAIREVKL